MEAGWMSVSEAGRQNTATEAGRQNTPSEAGAQNAVSTVSEAGEHNSIRGWYTEYSI